MDDLISRQAAISLPVKPREDRYFQTQSLDDAYDYGWRSLQRCIENLPSAQSEPRWIPTKEKPDPDLPKDDMSGYFFVTLHTYGNIGFDMDEYEVIKMRWNRVKGWVFPVHSPAWIEEALTQEVIAWKPCPEPYREEGVE